MVQTAGEAIFLLVVNPNGPVADTLLDIIAAQSILFTWRAGDSRPQVVAGAFKRTDDRIVGKKREGVVASCTNKALEEDDLIAASALEDFHVD